MRDLAAALEARAKPEGLEWLREASAAAAADASSLRSRFAMVGRKVGRETLDEDADPKDVWAWTVEDAIRTNDTRLIAAALGPYATKYLSDEQYDQAVLKCVFVGVPITGLDGIPSRVTPDGARMLGAFVHERVAAGRDLPPEVWTVIDKYPPAEEIAAIEAELHSPFDDRRAAAERALSYRS